MFQNYNDDVGPFMHRNAWPNRKRITAVNLENNNIPTLQWLAFKSWHEPNWKLFETYETTLNADFLFDSLSEIWNEFCSGLHPNIDFIHATTNSRPPSGKWLLYDVLGQFFTIYPFNSLIALSLMYIQCKDRSVFFPVMYHLWVLCL